MGLIALEGMQYYAYHGFYDEEQKIGNEYLIDVYVNTNFEQAASLDNINGTLNYERILEYVNKQMAINQKLLESLASNIANTLFDDFLTINHIKVRVSKLRPQMGVHVDRAMVEYEKSRI
ncbi:MAG: dihydroneopterin aldolase [Bacteroidota bacterium]